MKVATLAALIAIALPFVSCSRREVSRAASTYLEAKLRKRPGEAFLYLCDADRALAPPSAKIPPDFDSLFYPLMKFEIGKVTVNGRTAEVAFTLEGPDPKAALKELLAIDMKAGEGDPDYSAIQKLVAKIHEGKGFPVAKFQSKLTMVKEANGWRACPGSAGFRLGSRVTP